MKRLASAGISVTALLLASCTSLPNLVDAPRVSLRNVAVEQIELNAQTFLLSFDVTNPNPFPLPIRTIRYGVDLNGHRFATGETQSEFTVPAGSDTEFAISVDLNLLQTAPELLFIVREATSRDIPYAIEGELGVDIPAARPVEFRNEGLIRLQSALQ